MGAIVIHCIVKSSGLYSLTSTSQLLVSFLFGLPLTRIITAYYIAKTISRQVVTAKRCREIVFALLLFKFVNTLLDN